MENAFKCLNEFYYSLLNGREIQIKYNDKEYCILEKIIVWKKVKF